MGRKLRRQLRDIMIALSGGAISLTIVSFLQGNYWQAFVIALTATVFGIVLWMEGL